VLRDQARIPERPRNPRHWLVLPGTDRSSGRTSWWRGTLHCDAVEEPSQAMGERVLAEAYRDRIGVNATLWYVDDVGHTQALHRHPQEYATRVIAFLTAAMAPAR
jgi:hypothetical protein